jgi:hypothetical protein
MTRARQRALDRQNLPASDAIQLIRRINAKAATARKFQPIPIYGVAHGPTFVADDFGLPKQFPNQPQPASITKRRKFLQSLSPTQRNLLLTGDPVFAFDPIAYEAVLYTKLVDPELQQQFNYLLPHPPPPPPPPAPYLPEPQPELPPPQPPPGSPHHTPPASPPPGRVPQPPAAPRKPANRDDDHAPHPQHANDAAGASPAFDVHSPGADIRWMRSSPSSTPPYSASAPSSSGWARFKDRSREVAKDILQVPPPGWRPPGHVSKPSAVRKVLRQVAHEITHPPPPWFEQPPLPQQRPGAKPPPRGSR